MIDLQGCRLRFAPSPTGYLHIGGARTALFNWLLARRNKGVFILRIEDTDKEREVPGSIQQIIDSLKWLGIDYDEGPDCGGNFGPYKQSERLELYKKNALNLVQNGNAYYCFCSNERLEKMREEQKNSGQPTQYDRKCRELNAAEIKEKLNSGLPYVIRMKTPLEGAINFNDLIRGSVTIPYANVDDQVLLKSDGYPTYHLANVVDDHEMKITLVLRGEEWLMSTPKHLLLYKYFGWIPPVYGHLPLLLNHDKSKLSKRQGDVSVSDYKEKGFLPEAVMNFIALLGWNAGDDNEFFTKESLIEQFSIERCGKSGSVFDIVKLKWMNGMYIRNMKKNDIDGLAEIFRKALIEKKYIQPDFPNNKMLLFTELIGDVVETIPDIFPFAENLFSKKIVFKDNEALELSSTEQFKTLKKALLTELEGIEFLNKTNLTAIIKKIQNDTGMKGKELYKNLRVIISGEIEGRDLALLFLFLNKDGILERIR